jgi:hypothetical protein
MEESHFSRHFQTKRRDREEQIVRHPALLMRDIDRDGKFEVIFSPQTDNGFGEGALTCFDDEGGVLWEVQTAQELKFGETTYSPDYRIRGFGLSDLDNDGRLEILVISDHHSGFPTRFLVVNAQGRITGDYWNSGRIEDFRTVDLDGDGIKEIILCGHNEEFRQACLIVLDADRVRGSSPQSGRFLCGALDPGQERFYIRLPRTDLELLEPENLESAFHLKLLTNLKVATQTRRSGLYFEFDYTFTQASVLRSSSFEEAHMRASRLGRVRSTLGEDYYQKLADRILYYDGEEWVTEPMRRSVSDVNSR